MERDLRDEMRLHLELRAEQLGRHGLDADDATLAARRQFGNVSRIADASRDAWGWRWLDHASQDFRYLGRQLVRSPGFALVVTATIALGIGINTAAFTFYDAVVLKPLPVRAPEELVRVVQDQRIPAPELLPFSAYDALRSSARSVASVIATSGPVPAGIVLTTRGARESRTAIVRLVSTDYFAALGVRPAIGRAFANVDERAVVVSHAFWLASLNGDSSAIGRSVMVGGEPLPIVGVAPSPFAGTGEPAMTPDLWMPMALQPLVVPGADWRRDMRPHWQVLGRLTTRTTLEQSRAEVTAFARVATDTAGKPTPLQVKAATFFQSDSGEFEVFQQVSTAIMVALALILGIATVNLVNLIAARNAARGREIAVRLALGASRRRIARQLATESLVLSLLGGALGLVLAVWLAQLMRAWITGVIATVGGGLGGLTFDLSIDWRVLLYAAATSIAVGLIVGVWPAIGASRTDASVSLKPGTTSTGDRASGRLRRILLAAQVAACVVLLTAAGMLLNGLRHASDVDTGFDSDHMLIVSLDIGVGAGERSSLSEAQRRLSELPMVRGTAWSQRVPFGGTQTRSMMTPTGRFSVTIQRGSESMFDVLGVPMITGRTFTSAEVENDAPVVVVSRRLAEELWPGQSPIGRVIPPGRLTSGPDTTKSYSVIGMVANARTSFLSRPDPGAEYFPYSVSHTGSLLIRTRGRPADAVRPIRVALTEFSPSFSARATIVPLTDGPIALQRLMAQAPATVAVSLALLGLILAAIGACGLIAQVVSRRTREIGIYMALGATGPQVVWLVLRQTLRPVLWGAGLGGVGAVGVSLVLRSMVAMSDAPDLTFGGGAFNLAVFAGVAATLGLMVVTASAMPARRATRVDPAAALRTD
jgi:predicted permease